MTTAAIAAFPVYSIKGRQVEYKSFHFQVKSVDEDQGIITGYLSTFGNVDLQKDCVVKGAFKKTLTEAYARKAGGRKYLFALLWMHDPNQPIGGVLEAVEDAEGLLITAQLDLSVNAAGIPKNPIATMVFSGFKSGYVDELSMGYLAIQKDYEAGVRYLKEVALLEGSAITMLMAANPEALVAASGVKNMFGTKGASGKTTWPLAPRDTTWDGGEATKDIEEWADGDWSKVAQCFFWVAQNPPEKLDDCKLPFVAKVGDKMMAVPEGIIASVGGHGLAVADIPSEDEDAVKAKIAAYYKKMDMTPPWEDERDDGKRRAMTGSERKDFNDIHQAGKAADCLEDWCDLLNQATQALFQIFGMSDTPESDMQEFLNQFGEAVMKEWLPDALEANVGQYLNDRGYCNDPNSAYVPYSMRVGSDYGYMSRSGRPSHKAGRTISAATRATLEQHQSDMKALFEQHASASDDLASQFKSLVKTNMEAMQQKVSDLTDLWADEGQGPAYGNDDPPDVPNHNPSDDNGKSRFARREPATSTRPLPRREVQPPRKSRDTASSITLADLEAALLL